MSDLYCPYCDAGLEVCHDDGFGYEEDVVHEMCCKECNNNFVFQTHVTFTYFPDKADCLNGSDHNYGEWRRLWTSDNGKLIESRRCKDCDYGEQRSTPV